MILALRSAFEVKFSPTPCDCREVFSRLVYTRFFPSLRFLADLCSVWYSVTLSVLGRLVVNPTYQFQQNYYIFAMKQSDTVLLKVL